MLCLLFVSVGIELLLTAYRLAWSSTILGYECLIPGLNIDQRIVQSVIENMVRYSVSNVIDTIVKNLI